MKYLLPLILLAASPLFATESKLNPKQLHCLNKYNINMVDMPITCGLGEDYEDPKKRAKTTTRDMMEAGWQLIEVYAYDEEYQLMTFKKKE